LNAFPITNSYCSIAHACIKGVLAKLHKPFHFTNPFALA
jgi:hypothetical protein